MKYEKPIIEITLLHFDMVVTSGLGDMGDHEEGTGGGMDLSNLNNSI